MEEIWKDIEGFNGSYQVFNLGRVRSLDRWIEYKSRYGNPARKLIKGKIFTLCPDERGIRMLPFHTKAKIIISAFIA